MWWCELGLFKLLLLKFLLCSTCFSIVWVIISLVNCSRPLWSCGTCFSIKTIYQVEREFLEWKIITLLRLCNASRITLVKSVLASIPTYIASTFYLSKNICSKIDSCLGKFTWGHSEDKHSFFPMSWTKVCKPKDCAYIYIYAHQ